MPDRGGSAPAFDDEATFTKEAKTKIRGMIYPLPFAKNYAR
jgi:hypothetical protein